jgi:hypothetical protein
VNELPDDVKDLLRRGDPGQGVSRQMVARVSERLDTRSALGARWQGATLVVAMLGSAALGAMGTVVVANLAPGLVAPAPVVSPKPNAPVQPRSGTDAVSREAALVQRALEALARGETDLALEQLDTRDREFPSGVLSAESRVARVRVLLARGEDDAALERLSALPASDVTPTLRAEWVERLSSRDDCEGARKVAVGLEASEARAALGACAAQGGP